MRPSNAEQEAGIPWHVWGCMAIAFLIPTFKKFVPGFVVLLGIYCIVHAIRKRKMYIRHSDQSMVMMASMFLLLMLGIIQSEDYSSAMRETGIKFSYIGFPLIAWLIPQFSAKNYASVVRAFMFGCLAFIPAALIYGTYRVMQTGDAAYLSYQELGINYHPTYAATYQALSLYIMFRMMERSEFLFRRKSLHYIAMILTIVFISMLASKAGLISGAMAIVMGALPMLRKSLHVKIGIISATLSLAILASTAYLLPGVSARVNAAVQDVEENMDSGSIAEPPSSAHSSTELRIITWGAAWHILEEHPLGAGTGNTQKHLNEIYLRTGEDYALERNLNAHNEFLQIGAEHGWPGLIVFVLMLGFIFLRYLKTHDGFVLCFVSLCVMNFLFESFLEVQAGIVFFCFWAMLFSRIKK